MMKLQSSTSTLEDPRWIRVKPSKIAVALTLMAAAAALLVIVTLPLATWAITALWLVVATGGAFEVQRLFLRRANSIIAFYLIDLDDKNVFEPTKKTTKLSPALGIRLHHRDGRESEGQLRDGAFVMPGLMTIAYDYKDEIGINRLFRKCWPRTLPLWRDAITPDDARRTRVKLRWK